MNNCIFCKIINKEIPCYKIYENEYVLAFLDIANDVNGHTLVISKKHFKNILDCDIEYLKEVMKAVKLISTHYINNCGFDGVNVLNNNNKAAGQEVDHLHIHIIPRKNGDKIKLYNELNYSTLSLEEIHKLLEIK